MDFSSLINDIVAFGRENPLILAASALVVLLFVYRRPKLVFGLVGVALLLAVLYWFVMDLSGQGSQGKKSMLQKTEEPPP